MRRSIVVALVVGLCAMTVPSSRASAGDPEPRERTVLVTGFGAFGGFDANPSWLAVKRLEGETVGGARVVVAKLPVIWDEAAVKLAALVAEHEPAVVVCFGVAGGTDAFRLERTARNENRNGPDNDGTRLRGADIDEAPATYPSGLPLEAIAEALRDADIPVRWSEDAGGYLCNQLFFRVRHLTVTGEAGPSPAARRGEGPAEDAAPLADPTPSRAIPLPRRPGWSGFIHVPAIGERDSRRKPGLSLDELARGVRVVVETAVAHAGSEPLERPGAWY